MATWKKVWVKVPKDCKDCGGGICDTCAPDGMPDDRDIILWGPPQGDAMLALFRAQKLLDQANAQVREALRAILEGADPDVVRIRIETLIEAGLVDGEGGER